MAKLVTKTEIFTVEDTNITHLSESGTGSFKVTFLTIYNYILAKLNAVFASKLLTFNRQTASYTLVLGDASKVVEMNVGSANNLTVPPNSDVAFDVGTEIAITQYGAGQTTIVAGSGVTLRSISSALKISGQYAGVSLLKVGTNEWYVLGALTN